MSKLAESSAEKKKRNREARKARGFSQLEVWLPTEELAEIDRLKDCLGYDSRNDVILWLFDKTAGLRKETALSTN